MKPEQGWCVKSPKGKLMLYTVDTNVDISISAFVWVDEKPWEEFSKIGFTCVKVEVREVE